MTSAMRRHPGPAQGPSRKVLKTSQNRKRRIFDKVVAAIKRVKSYAREFAE